MSRVEGFAAIPNWMIRDESIGLYALAVYGALASHAGPGGIHPNRETIAREARCSVRQVARALDELEQIGVVVRTRRKSKVGRAPTGYELRPHGRLASDEEYAEVQDSQSSTSEVRDSGDRGSGLGVHLVPLTEEEPMKNITSELFEAFWKVYPRKVGKAGARKVFDGLRSKGVDLDAVVRGAQRFAADPNLPELRFVPHPTTWLNQGRWDDDPMPERDDAPRRPAPVEASIPEEIRARLAERRVPVEEYLEERHDPAWRRAYLGELAEAVNG